MATWEISSGDKFEREYRAKLGDAEFERRCDIANAKADELLGERRSDGSYSDDNFAEACILRPQFINIIMELKPETVITATRLSAKRWADIVYKLVDSNR